LNRDIWYIDPVWATKTFHQEKVEITSSSFVEENYEEYLKYFEPFMGEGETYFLHKEIYKNRKGKLKTNPGLKSINIISEDGKYLVTDLRGYMSKFKYDGNVYYNIGGFVVSMLPKGNIEASLKLNEVPPAPPELPEPDIEYIED